MAVEKTGRVVGFSIDEEKFVTYLHETLDNKALAEESAQYFAVQTGTEPQRNSQEVIHASMSQGKAHVDGDQSLIAQFKELIARQELSQAASLAMQHPVS